MAADKPDPKNNPKPQSADKPRKPPKPPKPARTGGGFFSALRLNLTLALLAAVLAFAGAVAGVVLTNAAQRALWEEEFAYDSEQRLVDKRVELIERTVLLMSKSYAVQEEEKDGIKEALSAVAKVATDPTSIVGLFRKNFREQAIAKCESINSRTEFTNILKLDAIFFGARTKRVVDKLLDADPWWDAAPQLRDDLIDAMHREFMEGFRTG